MPILLIILLAILTAIDNIYKMCYNITQDGILVFRLKPATAVIFREEIMKSLYWMILFVIFVCCVEDQTKVPSTTTTATAQTELVEKEQRIVSLLLSAETRKTICTKITVHMDGEKLEQIDCVTKSGDTIHYSAIAEGSIGFTFENGDIVSDDTIDGSVDYGVSADGSRKFFHEFRLNWTEGEGNRDYWQNRMQKLVDDIFANVAQLDKEAPNEISRLLLLYGVALVGYITVTPVKRFCKTSYLT